jgi:hypothetical protein
VTNSETIEFEALIERLELSPQIAQALRDFIDTVADAAYDRGQGIQQDINSGRI